MYQNAAFCGNGLIFGRLQILLFGKGLTLSHLKILDASKLKEFKEDNFKFDENCKVLQTGRKLCGKRRNCLLDVTIEIDLRLALFAQVHVIYYNTCTC